MGSVYLIRGQTLRKGDANVNVVAQLCEDNGTPVDLASANVRLFIKASTGSTLQANVSCTITNSNYGVVTATLNSDHHNASGSYSAEWQVNTSSYIRSFPTPGYTKVIIADELG